MTDPDRWRLPAAPGDDQATDAPVWLPDRYREPWGAPFDQILREALEPGSRVLDVGSGRSPFLPQARRPPNCHYVGLDISATELDAAPAGAYADAVVSDVNDFQQPLEGKFDIVLSWQVLEHVKPVATAVDHMRRYLKPGGVMASQLSGSRSLFGAVNKVIPTRVGIWAMERLLARDPTTVFPAHYDGCYYDRLRSLGAAWSDWYVHPRFKGGGYFGFAKPVLWAYVKYEDIAFSRAWNNLATHYIVTGTR